jgi:capsule biosynthesis phosphatase
MRNGGSAMGSALVVDVDGTLAPIKSDGESYAELEPIWPMVARLRDWQDQGFRIVLTTSRSMRTYAGNLGMINRHTAPGLVEWLERWNIPCDEIYFGKPWPGPHGFYIDDRTLRPDEFLRMTPPPHHGAIPSGPASREVKNEVDTDRLNIVITMAGRGSRFRDAGYDMPKWRIEVEGKTLFDWSLDSLEAFFSPRTQVIFVTLKEDEADTFIAERCAARKIDRYRIVPLPQLTDGQATSALQARATWWPEAPLAIYNIDTHVRPGAMRPEQISGAGWIPCFAAVGDHWSFVKVEQDGAATEVREKVRISPNATLGLYWFQSARLYEQIYRDYFAAAAPNALPERYIAPLYNLMIARGLRVTISNVPGNSIVPLGTPAEVEKFRTAFGRPETEPQYNSIQM